MKREIRPSKLIMSYGPGAILDMPNRESYMIMSPDYWVNHKIIKEKRLADKLNVDHFGVPENIWDKDSKRYLGVAIRDFPYIRYCPQCGRLTYDFYCRDCTDSDGLKGLKTMPPRLVAACKNGHIQDFPWKSWCGCNCDTRDSRLYLTGSSIESEGSDMTVVCRTCKKSKSLEGALYDLPKKCDGKRPWLGDREECDQNLRGLMRGGSNVYFPILESALSIPPYSKEIFRDLKDFFTPDIRSLWKEKELEEVIFKFARVKNLLKKYTKKQILDAFNDYFEEKKPQDINIKLDEWNTFLLDEKTTHNSDYQSSSLKMSDISIQKWFDKIVLVKRLREVLAIVGFSRIEPANLSDGLNKYWNLRMDAESWNEFIDSNLKITPAINIESDRNWLPGIEQFGEGIFFKFNENTVKDWASNSSVKSRCNEILNQPDTPITKEGIDTTDARLLLVHTFAHLIIREISLSCGYSTASLRERLYVENIGNNNMCGVLIYTASSDSEGTLGGLISQAKQENILKEHLTNMLQSAKICSQDPLCGAHRPSDTKKPWGASCHSCCQLPETSCESLRNKLLDRYTLIGNKDLIGYFND